MVNGISLEFFGHFFGDEVFPGSKPPQKKQGEIPKGDTNLQPKTVEKNRVHPRKLTTGGPQNDGPAGKGKFGPFKNGNFWYL